MQQRVTAILVARSGVEYLGRTLAGLQGQSRRPDAVIAVDVDSDDGSRDRLADSHVDQLIGAPAKADFGRAVGLALDHAPPSASENEWLWLLAHDNAPHPDALAELLGAVEIAPSVSVAGPKLMRWQQPDVIAEFGESMTRSGASVALVAGELDQAQHDVQHDVLGVAAGGMLVRRSLWTALDGFDPGLPSTDAGLDFSVRARLAGHRVITVPGARVASAGGPQHFGRRSVSEARRARVARAAQLHRRLVYAAPAVVPLHWLSLVPLAVFRSVLHLLAKRPGSIGAEFRAAFRVAFAGSSVISARRRLRRVRRVGWGAVAPLRLTRRQAREQLTQLTDESSRDPDAAPPVYREAPLGFVTGGGLWAVAIAAAVGLISFGRLIAQDSVSGGGLVPLSADVARLWFNVGYGWRDIGLGFTGAADPFAAILAVLGSVTFWQPSVAVVLLYLLALPLAALGAWFCARRFTARPWLPVVVSVLWSVAPPLLAALDAGRLGATIAHLLLPWLVLAAVEGVRSWAAAASAALLFAAVTASAPVLAPTVVVLWIAWVVARPRSVARLAGIPLPAIVLFAPLVIDQLRRGQPIALLADPGVPIAGSGTTASSGVQLAFGAPSGGSNGWSALLTEWGLAGSAGPPVVAVLLLPLGVLALLALFVRGSRRAIPALVVALLGFATAVLASRLELGSVGPDPVEVWPGSGVSLYWLGLLGAAAVSLDALRRGSVVSGSALGLATALVSLPLLLLPLVGASVPRTPAVVPGDARILPAIVDAEARTRPDVGTLFLYPEGDDALTAELQRGVGASLDDQSTLDLTATAFSPEERRLAVLAGNLASRSGFDSAAELDALGIEFIVLVGGPTTAVSGDSVFVRAQEALDGNAELAPIGQTATGLLWRYGDGGDATPPSGPGNTETAYGIIVLLIQGVVIAMTALLAIPTTRRRRRFTARSAGPETAATTFDEDTDD